MDQASVILLTLILSAFFSGSEMAFLSSNKLLIELNRKRTPRLSKITDRFHTNPGLFISTILIGNNIALVVYGIYMANLIEPEINRFFESDFPVLFIQTIISTIIILVVAEFLPKILFRLNPGFTLNLLSIPLFIFYSIFFPFSKLVLGFSNFFIRKILKAPGTPIDSSIVIGAVDLSHLITEHQEKADEDEPMPEEMKFFKNALDFSNIKVRECLIPRTEIAACDIDETLDNIRQKFIETGHSKILIFKENIDDIIGYVHVSSLFRNPQRLRNIISPLSVVPETMAASKLLETFTKEHKSIALVVDEFGGTAGIVTLEDILEEIFGEIDDEHDTSDLIEKQIDEYTYQFSGRFEIDYLNDKYPTLQLPVSDNYETLAGLILFKNEAIPAPNEELDFKHFNIQIIEATKSKVELVQISIKD
ncbi:hemolysin family protein [Alkalitalea saponilacus]|uniref:Hemolysin, contains CBS domains n=1 Tax=Alkalitalea saponilacus TaxID=889453 RepID=A0A1T5HRG8_9BACT|nr:hemolysin family protein [Alkalitalea saponilacus]ASB48388.1 hemolysin [Alkalitalea saponilacus]SKC23140.1 Hemolysin, contains CBS domains [Alkalitalea saponilacus]